MNASAGMFRGVLQNHRAETIHSALIFLEANMKGKTHEESHEIWEQMRAYKAQGHTHQEVAEEFNLSLSTCWKVCKGISPQPPNYNNKIARNQYTSGKFDREQNARNKIQQYIPDFEYAGGFTSMDGSVDIKCKTCGNVITRSFISIRHNHVGCPFCREQERTDIQQARDAEAERKRTERQKLSEERRAAKQAAYDERHKLHACMTCGQPTTRPKYCSKRCGQRANDRKKETTRRVRRQCALVDRDITLEKLYERDGGRCYLCGGLCDWQDSETKEGSFIAGNMYPSIDHVKPLSKGGTHAWDNIKLAHRLCNSLKGNTITPLM